MDYQEAIKDFINNDTRYCQALADIHKLSIVDNKLNTEIKDYNGNKVLRVSVINEKESLCFIQLMTNNLQEVGSIVSYLEDIMRMYTVFLADINKTYIVRVTPDTSLLMAIQKNYSCLVNGAGKITDHPLNVLKRINKDPNIMQINKYYGCNLYKRHARVKITIGFEYELIVSIYDPQANDTLDILLLIQQTLETCNSQGNLLGQRPIPMISLLPIRSPEINPTGLRIDYLDLDKHYAINAGQKLVQTFLRNKQNIVPLV